jgi:acetylglutamate kinase
VRLILIHGGGKPIDRAMTAAGLEPRKVAGRRYTDEATLEIVVQVLGEINTGIVSQIRELGAGATGYDGDRTDLHKFPIRGDQLMLSGTDGQRIDLGRVGRVVEVDRSQLEEVLEEGRIPVIPSIAFGVDGDWLNVNADTAASAVAGALKAEACYFLTDTPGVLRDIREPGSLLPRLTTSECRQLIADGVIAGGMIPKVEACFEALDAGARRAVILDGRDPYALLGEFVSDRVAGTEIVN